MLHLHAAINHLPFAAVFFGLAVLTAGVFQDRKDFMTVAFGLFFFGAIFAIATTISGEVGHDTAEKFPWVRHKYIEAHEEAAKIGLWVTTILGALMTFGHFKFKAVDNSPKWFINVSAILAAISMVALMSAGKLGGEIMHKEFRPDFMVNAPDYPTGNEIGKMPFDESNPPMGEEAGGGMSHEGHDMHQH